MGRGREVRGRGWSDLEMRVEEVGASVGGRRNAPAAKWDGDRWWLRLQSAGGGRAGGLQAQVIVLAGDGACGRRREFYDAAGRGHGGEPTAVSALALNSVRKSQEMAEAAIKGGRRWRLGGGLGVVATPVGVE